MSPIFFNVFFFFWLVIFYKIASRRGEMVKQYLGLQLIFYFLNLRKFHFLKNIFYRSRWASKILVVLGSYKRYTSWLKFKMYYTDLRYFITAPWRTRHEEECFNKQEWISTIFIFKLLSVFKLKKLIIFLKLCTHCFYSYHKIIVLISIKFEFLSKDHSLT